MQRVLEVYDRLEQVVDSDVESQNSSTSNRKYGRQSFNFSEKREEMGAKLSEDKSIVSE